MATNYSRAALVSRHVELEAILLRAARLDSDIDPIGEPPELNVSFSYQVSHERIEESGRDLLQVKVEFAMTGQRAAKLEMTAGTFSATYVLLYNLNGAAEIPEDAFFHFAWLNGVHNAWPYWREIVQTVSGRAGWPSVMVPLFRPPLREIGEEHDANFYATASAAEESQ